jgi:hypothetical protein
VRSLCGAIARLGADRDVMAPIYEKHLRPPFDREAARAERFGATKLDKLRCETLETVPPREPLWPAFGYMPNGPVSRLVVTRPGLVFRKAASSLETAGG